MSATKRLMPPVHHEANKRRAPYTPRACDACRRRKGRCDGRKPCEYCLGRSADCRYSSSNPDDRQANGRQPGKTSGDEASQATKWTPTATQSLTDLVAALQKQSDAIVAHVKMHSEPQDLDSAGGLDAAIFARNPAANQANIRFPSSGALHVPAMPAAASKHRSQQFYGPTSPDYCLIAAQRRAQRGKVSDASPGEQSLPSLDDNKSEDEEYWAQETDSPVMGSQPTKQAPQMALLHFLSLFTRQEAIRLLMVYQETVGILHPICDIERLLEQMEWLYRWSTGVRNDSETPVDEDALLILNIALSIALCAEGACKTRSANILYNSYRDIVNANRSAPATNIEHVKIAILEGIYHFYMCNPCLAWRIVGMAGRIAMEMGIHSEEVCRQCFETDQQRLEVATISCTLLILDRQWSAATGLRPNFQKSDFEMAQVAMVHTPYLKAMMVFTLMSDNFNEPIARAAQGNSYVDDNNLEVTDFQVQQWRERALEKHNFIHPKNWDSSTETPASWTLILYLRANAIRAILLRSFFLANPTTTDVKKIKRGLEVVLDSIGVLSILDKTTNIYRVQHPHFQHFLASSCALLFLIVAYTEHRKATTTPHFPEDYAETVQRNFEATLRLSAAYRNTFPQSHKLWKRINAMKEPLARLGILPHESEGKEFAVSNEPAPGPPTAEEPSQEYETPMKAFDAGPPVSLYPSAANDWAGFDLEYETQRSNLNLMGALPAAIVGKDSPMDLIDPLFLDWPMYTTQRFFSESIF